MRSLDAVSEDIADAEGVEKEFMGPAQSDHWIGDNDDELGTAQSKAEAYDDGSPHLNVALQREMIRY